MNGLGGLNKSENGVVIGLVQLQLPVTVTPADLARQTARVVELVAKARRNLVVFPEYMLHGLSMDTNPAIMCRMDGPEVAALKQACIDNAIWGCFSIMEHNPGGYPYNTGLIIDDKGEVQLYYRKMHPWVPVEPWEPGDLGIPVCTGPKGARIGLIICHDGMFPGRDHDPHRRLHCADPAKLALHQPVQQLLQPDGHGQCLHVRLGRHLRQYGRRHDRQLRRHRHCPRHLGSGGRNHHRRGPPRPCP
jgi:predicted amidohydrolase